MWNRLVFLFFYWLFKILHKIIRQRPDLFKSDSFKNILIFSTTGIGGALMDSPAIRAIKGTYPNVRLIVVAHKGRSSIARHNPYIDRVVEYKKGFLSFIYFWKRLKRENFDAVVILRGNDPDIWPLAYLIKPNALVSNPGRTRMKFLISHPAIVSNFKKLHGVEQSMAVVKVLGAETKDKRLVYQITEDELREAKIFLSKIGLDKTNIIVFQIGGGKRLWYRNWSWQNYAELGRLLLTEFEVAILLLGGKEYREDGEKVVERLKENVLNLAGRTSLEQTAALLKHCNILVTTDTGVMHLAFAVGVQTLALLHYLHPAEIIGPYNYEGRHTLIQLPQPEDKDIIFTMDSLAPSLVYEKLRLLCQSSGLKKKYR